MAETILIVLHNKVKSGLVAQGAERELSCPGGIMINQSASSLSRNSACISQTPLGLYDCAGIETSNGIFSIGPDFGDATIIETACS